MTTLTFDVDGIICGVDEAGRGCLAGPIFAAAVVLNEHRPIAHLNDSKQMSARRRSDLATSIIKKCFAYGIGTASAEEIDTRGLDWANRIVFTRAVRHLLQTHDDVIDKDGLFVLIDGIRPALRLGIRQKTIPKGDQKVAAISAASILAKTSRDRWVVDHLHRAFPHFGFDAHKGYPTKKHLDALRAWGPTPHHRRSFSYSL